MVAINVIVVVRCLLMHIIARNISNIHDVLIGVIENFVVPFVHGIKNLSNSIYTEFFWKEFNLSCFTKFNLIYFL